jgi:hypothetical protein
MKFGIFSKATLLEGESRTEYEHLSNGIRESLAPVGALEEQLVDKLVTNMWRYQRMLRAEGAEVQRYSKFLQVGRRQLQLDGGDEIGLRTHMNTMSEFDPEEAVGLIWNSQNPDALARCLELLAEVRQAIKAKGFVEGRDDELLCKIYGDPEKPHLRPTLYESYLLWRETANATKEETAREEYATPEQCKQTVLREISQEIKLLEECRGELQSIETERMNLEILRQGVPDTPRFERLVRYSSSLERDFDRTIGQLERIQRMRKGQPVSPRVDVNFNA